MKAAIIKSQLSSVPSKRKLYTYHRDNVGAFNRKNSHDSGGVYEIKQIDPRPFPFVCSADAGIYTGKEYSGSVLELCICDGVIYALSDKDGYIVLSEYDPTDKSDTETLVCQSEGNAAEDCCLVRYNEYTSITDAIDGEYKKKILVLPMYYCGDIGGGGDAVFESDKDLPASNVGTVYMSRIFSAYKGKIFASEFNRAMSYSFDTADSTLTSNAWMSNTQSNTKADGEITALAVYDGHVVVFKRDYMMQIYNTENPFRLVDIGSFGCISKRAVCEYDGKLAFVSPQGVMLYSGGYPYFIGEELNIKNWEGAMLCARDKLLYVYVPSEHGVYVYDSEFGLWGHRDIDNISFMCADHTGAYYIHSNKLYLFDGDVPSDFYISTDKNTLGYNGKKRICEIGVVANLSPGADLSVSLVDEDDAPFFDLNIAESGEYILRKKVKGISLDFARLVFSGCGKVKIGDWWLKYRKEDEW